MVEPDYKHMFQVETEHVKEGTPRWWAIKMKYDMMEAGKGPVEDFRRSMVRSIIKMSSDIVHLQSSTFNGVSAERVMRIGAAMKVLHDELKKNGLTNTKGEGYTKNST